MAKRNSTTRKVLILRTGSHCEWKKNIFVGGLRSEKVTKKRENPGFINPVLAIFFSVVLSGMFYLHTINEKASLGIEIKKNESLLEDLRINNEQLKIQEARVKSFYFVEESGKNLNMIGLQDVEYIDEVGYFELAKK